MADGSIPSLVIGAVEKRAAGYAGKIGLETPLGPDGVGLDSIACLELLLELEHQTGCRLREEDMTEDALATVGGLIAHLEQARTR